MLCLALKNGVFDNNHLTSPSVMTSFGTQKHKATNIANITLILPFFQTVGRGYTFPASYFS